MSAAARPTSSTGSVMDVIRYAPEWWHNSPAGYLAWYYPARIRWMRKH